MAAITRLSPFGYGAQRTGSFLRLFTPPPVDLADVETTDALVTLLATTDALVTRVTTTEWPV